VIRSELHGCRASFATTSSISSELRTCAAVTCSDRVLATLERSQMEGIVGIGVRVEHDGDADGPTKLDTFAWHSSAAALKLARAAMLSKSPTAVLPDVLTALREIAGSPPPTGKDLAEHAAKLHS
jgi:hypothetical protein